MGLQPAAITRVTTKKVCLSISRRTPPQSEVANIRQLGAQFAGLGCAEGVVVSFLVAAQRLRPNSTSLIFGPSS